MAYAVIPTRVAGVDLASAADVNQLMLNCAAVKSLAEVSIQSISSTTTIATLTQNTIVVCDSSARAFSVNLPSAVASSGFELFIVMSANGGRVTPTRAGSDTIGGYTTSPLESRNDMLRIISDGTATWKILHYRSVLDSGYIKTSDYTDRFLGATPAVSYTGGAGSLIVGEPLVEYNGGVATGVSGIIVADSGTAATLKNLTGDGVFTNGYTITGTTSGVSKTVNGNTLNVDFNTTHGYASTMYDRANLRWNISTSSSGAWKYKPSGIVYDGTTSYGILQRNIDGSSFAIQTGAAGILILDTNGARVVLDDEAYFWNMHMEVNI